jgi:hypothetical protein
MQGSTSAGGKVAKCASANGAVAIVQTERLLRPVGERAGGESAQARGFRIERWSLGHIPDSLCGQQKARNCAALGAFGPALYGRLFDRLLAIKRCNHIVITSRD